MSGKHERQSDRLAASHGKNSRRQIQTQQSTIKSCFFLKLKILKPCCCDDCCEFVETTGTPTTQSTWRRDSRVSICENRGKRNTVDTRGREIHNFVRFDQQAFLTILNPSPQTLAVHWRAIKNDSKHRRFLAFQRKSTETPGEDHRAFPSNVRRRK
jgi:hypothetical protein